MRISDLTEILIIMCNMYIRYFFVLISVIFSTIACDPNDSGNGTLELLQVFVGTEEINLTGDMSIDLPVDRTITLVFSLPLDRSSAIQSIKLITDNQETDIDINLASENKSVVIFPSGSLKNNSVYNITISNDLKGAKGESFSAKEISFKTVLSDLTIRSVTVNDEEITETDQLTDVPLDLAFTFNFSVPVDRTAFESEIDLSGANVSPLIFAYSNDDQTVEVKTTSPLRYLSKYKLSLSNSLTGAGGEAFLGYSVTFYTAVDETLKFPVITDEELLTKVQEQTFKYFWSFAHPVSGLARERNTSGDIVTTGGSGFGVMAILVGIERGFITRSEGVERLTTIVDFLTTADRFHGAWPHWLNGETGEVIPFGTKDNGGDLVETAFMIEGLLTVRAYLDDNIAEESALIDKISTLWEEVEWTWYTQGGQNVLYWHWSPDYDWDINMKIAGYNEALIVYILAASSPTYPITKAVYDEGWAKNGDIANGNTYYDIVLPVGYAYGGPLFFSHYSFLGLDPRNLSDQYANYWEQNVNHTLINYSYCVDDPKGFVGYSGQCWGLTASDNQSGYSAHSPTNDLGVITPTAAISSIPYTPGKSIDALKYFYYTLGDRLWGEYGFYDAFNVTENWYADSYIAIDQGPIISMIENYRTALLWDLFMTDPDVQNGLDLLEFNY